MMIVSTCAGSYRVDLPRNHASCQDASTAPPTVVRTTDGYLPQRSSKQETTTFVRYHAAYLIILQHYLMAYTDVHAYLPEESHDNDCMIGKTCANGEKFMPGRRSSGQKIDIYCTNEKWFPELTCCKGHVVSHCCNGTGMGAHLSLLAIARTMVRVKRMSAARRGIVVIYSVWPRSGQRIRPRLRLRLTNVQDVA